MSTKGAAKQHQEAQPPAASWAALVLAVLAAAHFAWFIAHSSMRRELLGRLRDPFAIVAEWLGPAGTPLGLLDRLPLLLLAAAILLAGYGLGRLLTDRLRLLGDLTVLEKLVFALAIGLNVLSTAVLLLGLAGLLRQAWLMWLVVVGGCGLALWSFYDDYQRQERIDRSALGALRSALAWVTFPFALLILLGALLPPGDFDVREYHLQVPKEWLQQGRIGFLPHNVYGNMPLGAEMHALSAMALWPGKDGWFYGALAGKVVIAAHAVLTAAGLVAAGKRIATTAIGWLAAAAYLAHPWVVHVSINGLNDGVLACYVFLAVYALWLARGGACSFVMAGWLAGAAAAVKYPGLAFAMAPLAVWCCIPWGWISEPSFSQAPRTRLLVALALFLVGAMAGGGAWYAKNAVLAGNPVYPLAYSLLDGKSRTPEKDAQWQKAHQVPHDEQGRQYSLSQLTGSLTRIAGRDPLASPLMAPLLVAFGAAVLTPAFRNLRAALPFAFCFLLVLGVWWLFSHRIDRFLLAAWPFAALLVASAAWWIDDLLWRRTVQVLVTLSFAYCLLADSSPMVGDNRWFVSLAQLRRDGPWPEGTPLRVSPAHQLLNAQARPGQAVLAVGHAAPFDLEMPVYYSTCFDDCLLCDWMLGKSFDQRRAELARRNIAWVYVDWPWVRRYQGPGNYGFDPRFDPRLLDELVQQGILGEPQSVMPPAGGQPLPPQLYPVLPAPSVPRAR
jgi:hypothetical protein